MKREWPRMRQMDKNSGRHRLADATLPDRRNMLAAHLSGQVVCIVNTSNSSMAREPPCVFGVAAQLF